MVNAPHLVALVRAGATFTGGKLVERPGDQAVARFAVAYADQNERDHAALAAAVSSGRLPAQTDL